MVNVVLLHQFNPHTYSVKIPNQWPLLKIKTPSGVAKVGHTGAHALPTYSCAPPRCFIKISKIATITLFKQRISYILTYLSHT